MRSLSNIAFIPMSVVTVDCLSQLWPNKIWRRRSGVYIGCRTGTCSSSSIRLICRPLEASRREGGARIGVFLYMNKLFHAYEQDMSHPQERISLIHRCDTSRQWNSCHTLQHTSTHCNTLQHISLIHRCDMSRQWNSCHTQTHTATHFNTLQHTATHLTH